jgi:hypothetical protein
MRCRLAEMPKKTFHILLSFFLALHLNHPAAADSCPCSHLNAEGIASGACKKGEDSSTLCHLEWATHNLCGCSKINADSVANGACSKGEDSTTACRMEWDGGSEEKTSVSALTGRPGPITENGRKYDELNLDDNRLGAIISPYLEQYAVNFPKNVYSRAASISKPTEAREAAQVIDRQLWRDFPGELIRPVIYLAARAYYPFAENPFDDSEALTRMLASTAQRWQPVFASDEGQPNSFDVRDERRRLEGTLTVSTDCLDVRIRGVLVMVKGPRSRRIRDCGESGT